MGPVRLVLAGAVSLIALAPARGAAAIPPTCPPLAAARQLPQNGPAARTDIDADGVPDRAWIAAQPAAPGFCGIFLVVKTRRGVAAIRVPGNADGPASASLRQGLPRLFGLLRLGGEPDLEAVVMVDRGTDALAFATYRLEGKRLARVAVPGPSGNKLDWAVGSAAFGSVDCSGKGRSTRLRDAFAEQQGDGSWLLTRHTYHLSDSRLMAENALSAVVPKRPKVPAGLPFAHCTGLRAGG